MCMIVVIQHHDMIMFLLMIFIKWLPLMYVFAESGLEMILIPSVLVIWVFILQKLPGKLSCISVLKSATAECEEV